MLKNLKEKLEYYYQKYNNYRIDIDPVQFPHRFSNNNDIEIMAFISSVFAYGNIKQIISSLEKFILITENQPYNFILNYNKKLKINLNHRFYRTEDIHNLLLVIKGVMKKYGSLKNLFLSEYTYSYKNIKIALSHFSRKMLHFFESSGFYINNSVKFMFPLPENRSACKRMNLFLRWMVRKDNVDFGLWSEISKDKLIIPVDTHIAQISKRLNFTKRQNVSWKMAEEITESLKKFDPNDPVKYDFSLCHIEIRKIKF